MSVDYTKLKVEEIREMILRDSQGAMTEEDVNEIKGKRDLVRAHQLWVTDTPEDESDTDTDTEIEEEFLLENIPQYGSPEWEPFVLSKFTESEVDEDDKGNKYPKVAGLRRVANMLLGPIIDGGVTKLDLHGGENSLGHASVIYQIVFRWELDGSNESRVFRAVAGANIHNTDPEFAVFPEAIAETRAESRALRKALGVTNVAAEELTKMDVKEIVQSYRSQLKDSHDESLIQDRQKNVINKICDRMKIDVNKFISSEEFKQSSLDSVPRDIATKMIEKLNKYQTTGEDSLNIPEEIKK